MKNLSTVVILIASLAIASGAAKIVKVTDFSGEWTLDEGASKLGERARQPKTMNVTQGKTTLTTKILRVGRNGEESEVTTTYNLGGEETVISGRVGSSRSTAIWTENNSRLTITTSRTMSRNGNEMTINNSQSWTLSKDGKTLTITGTNSTPRGNNSFTAVYTKK